MRTDTLGAYKQPTKDREMSYVKIMDNDKFMNHLMTNGSCPTVAMSQLFVIDAVAKHAERVVDNADECREKMKSSFIHPESWIKTAEWIKRELDQRNQGNTNE